MKPRVAFFDFASCEGCQLEALNLDAGELLDLIAAVDIVNFREAMSESSDTYDIAFIEGSVTRESDIARLEKIRQRAKILDCSRRLCHYRWSQLSKKPYANGGSFKNRVWGGCEKLRYYSYQAD